MVNQKPIYHPGQAVGYCVLALLVALALPAIFVFAIWILIARKILNQKKVVISGQKNYVFKETRLVEIQTSLLKGVEFKNSDNTWLRIYTNTLNPLQTIIEIDGTQLTGYAWDGCSPKFQLGDLIFGTPDGVIGLNSKPKTYYASMAHDILYQFRDQLTGKVTRKQADAIFLEQMKSQQFLLANLYYRGVRMFGGLFWKSK